jgi:hypothetical protein
MAAAEALPFNTLESKRVALQAERDQRAALGRVIDDSIRKAGGADDAPRGCFASVIAVLLRRRPRGAAGATARVAVADAPASSGAGAAGNRTVHRAVFGLAGSKKAASASEKLEEALAAMRARVEQLEVRAQEGRIEAARLAKAGQKTAALRALKKAKAVDAQVASNQAAVDAVEQQLDTLSQAAMQKTLASALASTSATMKKDAKALSKAETAIEDAQEARDMATDLNQVMAEFAQSGNGYEDEDELLAELNAMVAEQDAPGPPPTGTAAAVPTEEDAARAAARALEAKHAEYDAEDALRAALPAAPQAQKKLEKRSLLSDDGAVSGVLAAG